MYLSPIALKTSSQGSHPNRRVICYCGVFCCDLWNRTTRGYIYQLGSWDRPYTIITICYTNIL